MVKVKIRVRNGRVLGVDLPERTKVSIHRYDLPKSDLIDKDPKGKKCSTQHWIRYDPVDMDIKYIINVYISGKVMQVKAPKGVEVSVVEEEN